MAKKPEKTEHRRQYQAQWQREWREEMLEAGLCGRCGAATRATRVLAGGREKELSACERCLALSREVQRKRILKKRRELRRKKRSENPKK